FWVGRYGQRVLCVSRFIRIVLRNLSQIEYINKGPESESNKILLQALTHLTSSYPGFIEESGESLLEEPLQELHQLICNPENTGSILSSLNNLLKAMYAVRNRWSLDNWRVIDEIENIKRKLSLLEPEELRQVFSLLDQLNIGLLSFFGMNRESMYREEGWTLYCMGKVIENISLEISQYRSLLTIKYEEGTQFKILEALLLSNQNLTNYRSVYRTHFDLIPVLDLLFFNKQNPSSLLYQLEELMEQSKQLPQKDGIHENIELTKQIFEAYSIVRLASIEKMLETEGETDYRAELDLFCERLNKLMFSIAAKLNAAYFSHSTYQYQGAKGGFQFEV
ncbi:MAG TPA: alpha-E domain-containing protein, partial [Cytophagaceae bacterium]|nr:alpha-E domain-containing protein [Cytophagaceae bacterium]